MVQIPSPEAQLARRVGERERSRYSRTHHNWGARFGRRREDTSLRAEPATLQQLEALAHRQLELMEKHGCKTEGSFRMVMDLLRQQYNLNFRILCEKCNGPHQHLYDEIDAPER